MPTAMCDLTGEHVDTRSEAWRHDCECRYVLSMPTREQRLAYIDGLHIDGKLRARGIRQIRGDAAAERLMADVRRLWEIRRQRAAATEQQEQAHA